MGHYVFSAQADAPRELVFDLWVDVERADEWIEGLSAVTDVTGPFDRAGTRYTAWFGRMRTPSEVLEASRPRLIRTRFGNRLLRGISQATFEPTASGTLITQEFWTQGIVASVAARLFATGSYRGSFRGELASFVRVAENEALERSKPA